MKVLIIYNFTVNIYYITYILLANNRRYFMD